MCRQLHWLIMRTYKKTLKDMLNLYAFISLLLSLSLSLPLSVVRTKSPYVIYMWLTIEPPSTHISYIYDFTIPFIFTRVQAHLDLCFMGDAPFSIDSKKFGLLVAQHFRFIVFIW